MFGSLGKMLILFGIFIIIIGVLLIIGERIPFVGGFPGDIIIRRERFTFYFPIVTCIILSLIITLILSLFRR